MPDDGSPPPGPATVVLPFPPGLRRAAVPELCARLDRLLRSGPEATVILDTTPVGRPDAVVVEAIARLALVARRHRRPVQVHAPPRVWELLALTGLAPLVGRPGQP
ncbi:STAS domain-containing protein, partial [Parafrankia discariae]|uniref:STAS domain-containing protein n=1 Tax=Parafrankia discariae TaxID=365528 RepID=UPI0003A212F2